MDPDDAEGLRIERNARHPGCLVCTRDRSEEPTRAVIEAVPGPIGRALDRIESSLREPNLVRFSSSWAVVLGATLALEMLVAALLPLAGHRGD